MNATVQTHRAFAQTLANLTEPNLLLGSEEICRQVFIAYAKKLPASAAVYLRAAAYEYAVGNGAAGDRAVIDSGVVVTASRKPGIVNVKYEVE